MTLHRLLGVALSAVLVAAFSLAANAQKAINEAGVSEELFLPTVTPAPGVLFLHPAIGSIGSDDEQMAKALAAAAAAADARARTIAWFKAYLK